jgi:hypothetical protein
MQESPRRGGQEITKLFCTHLGRAEQKHAQAHVRFDDDGSHDGGAVASRVACSVCHVASAWPRRVHRQAAGTHRSVEVTGNKVHGGAAGILRG